MRLGKGEVGGSDSCLNHSCIFLAAAGDSFRWGCLLPKGGGGGGGVCKERQGPYPLPGYGDMYLGAHSLPKYGDIPRAEEASPVLGCGRGNPGFAFLARSCSLPLLVQRSLFARCSRDLRQPSSPCFPLPPRWKTKGGGVRGTGRLPSKPLRGPLAPAGGIKARRLLASLSLGWLPGSVPGETRGPEGWRLPNQSET